LLLLPPQAEKYLDKAKSLNAVAPEEQRTRVIGRNSSFVSFVFDFIGTNLQWLLFPAGLLQAGGNLEAAIEVGRMLPTYLLDSQRKPCHHVTAQLP